MKAFSFRLERILSWRIASLKAEGTRLEQIRYSLELAKTEKENLALAISQATRSTSSDRIIRGTDLHLLATYAERLNREMILASQKIATLMEAVTKQLLAVSSCDRNVRLLERLRGRRREEWQADMNRELDELSAEFAGGQWQRTRRDPVRSAEPQ
jgi:hypothetical protein